MFFCQRIKSITINAFWNVFVLRKEDLFIYSAFGKTILDRIKKEMSNVLYMEYEVEIFMY